MRRRDLLNLAAAGSLAPLSLHAQAQAPGFPNKPIRIIVPATPGGTSDIFSRAIALRLQEVIGQPVLVEYKPGASTNIGSEYVARSAPDGYTLLMNGITLSVNPLIYPNMSWDMARAYAPIIEVAALANVVTVHPSVPAKNMKELVQLLKENPGKFNYGSPATGSSGNLSGELLAMKTGTKIVHVVYQGNAQATTDHVGGTLQLGFVNIPVGIQFVKTGKLRALAVTSAKRSALMPDVPTVAEALDMPDYELTGWFGLVAPAGTPPAIVERLHREVDKLLKDPAMRETIATAGGDVTGGSSADFDARIKRDAQRLGPLLKESGIAMK